MYFKCLRIIYLISLLVVTSCSKQVNTCNNRIVLKTTGSSFLKSYSTYIVTTDGSGQVSCTLPQSLGDTPVWSPDRQWVAYSTQFTSQSDTESQIFAQSTVSGKRFQLTFEKDGAVTPVWSPDGRRIAYQMTNGIAVLDVNCLRKNETCEFKPTFLANGVDPHWSPDNNLITYVYQGSTEGLEIRVIDVDQPNFVTDITPSDVKFCKDPRWSPDGSTIAVGCSKENSHDIYLINWSTLQATNITNSPGIFDTDPEWSPDGTQIVFVSDKDRDLGECLVDECTLTSTSLYTMNVNGDHMTRITFRSDEDIIWFSWIP